MTKSLEARIRALEEYEADKAANSGAANANTWFQLWSDLHVAWFGEDTPVLPLTVQSIASIAASFKAGRFRSFGNYISVAKKRHIEKGFVWSDALALEHKSATRSVKRGLGPGKQCTH